jgi:nuclease-like protein
MKIIDKTPLVNEKGELSILQRIQGMLNYGFSWPRELETQKAIITYFDRQLEKGYTLIRNYTLGRSGITVPIILLGPTGIYVIQISYLRGRYEVKGDAWNEASGEGYKPASVNLVQQTLRMAKAVRAFIERQGVKVPVEVEPVLIAGDPGLHIESVRPAIRVMMIDGIKSFVSNLATGQPVLSTESVFDFTDRIMNPHFPKKARIAPVVAPVPAPQPPTAWEEQASPQEVSRARAIFNASQDLKPFDPADFDFAMDDEPASEVASLAPGSVESSPAQPLPSPRPHSRRILGMTPVQLAIIAALVLVLLCIVVGFAIYYFFILS